MSSQKSCAIVVPIYKTSFTRHELVALEQCKNVLNSYHIVVIKPADLVLSDCEADLSFISNTFSFKNDFFNDISGYNALMMSSEFYKAFLEYDYILIYQLDAFVFKDDLSKWCNMDYDYIGAPWLRKKVFTNKFKHFKERIRSFYHRRYNPIRSDGLPDTERQMVNQVGNGGLSLRKVNRFYHLSIQYQTTINKYLQKNSSHYNEDIFWSIELNRKSQVIKVPKYKEALHFAIETEPDRAFKIINNEIPFGCHAWDKNIEFWRPIFKAEGIEI